MHNRVERCCHGLAIVFLAGLVSQGVVARAEQTPEHPHDHGVAAEPHEHADTLMSAATEKLDAVETLATAFSGDIAGLPHAVPTATVELQDGDSYEITAAYVKKQVGNRTLRMLAYNGSVPGPFIKAAQGSEITIRFHNHTDVEQTIHSHGVRIDNRYDGVPGITQDSVQPGQSFTYVVHFRDAGVFWYHPHTREDYGQEMGLYGNYLIDPSTAGYWGPVNREIPLVVDDVLIENDRIASFYREFTNYALLGRFGNDFLVNGESAYTLAVKKGEVIRFFITNVSNARPFNLSLPGVQTKLVGADLGKLEHETFVGNLVISPAERLVVEAYFPNPGSYQLTHTQPDGQIRLSTITVSADAVAASSHVADFLRERHNDEVMDEFAGFRRFVAAEADKQLLFTIDLGTSRVDHSMHTHTHTEEELHDHSAHVARAVPQPPDYQPMTPSEATLKSLQWSDPMQSDRTHRTPEISWKLVDEATGKEGMDIDDWIFRQGDLVKIRLSNDPNADHIMQHPMHLHGQQFVVLAVNGLPNGNMAWKDTTLVAPGDTVDILAKMSNPGVWMAHCHIAEHLHAGMALTFRVEDEDGGAVGDDYRARAHQAHRH